MTTARREQAKALFTELKSLLREIQETEAAGLVQDAPGGIGLPALLGSLRSLRELCSARAHLYARASPTSSAGKKHSGVPRRKAAPDLTAATGPRRGRT